MTFQEMAWTAGIFEGEGSIVNGHRRPRRVGEKTLIKPYPSLIIGMTDRDVLDRFQKAVNVGKVYGPYVLRKDLGTPRKPMFQWRCSRFEHVQALICFWWRWLGARRKTRATEVFFKYQEACLDQI